MPEWTFASELKLSPINVPRAALHLAREIAYPQLDVAAYMRQLHEMAETARPAVAAHETTADRTAALAAFFTDSLHFRGNATAYYAADNSYLNRVVDTRQGIPISLSVLFVDLAQRLGLPAFGLGLPGHFVTGLGEGPQPGHFVVIVRSDSGPIYLDPFHKARLLSEADCRQLVAETTGYDGPLRPEWLRPLPPQTILTRMLNNLRQITIQQQTWATAARVVTRLRLLQPEEAALQRDQGLIYLKLGDPYRAARHLDAYLTAVPDADDADALKTAVGPRIAAWSRQN